MPRGKLDKKTKQATDAPKNNTQSQHQQSRKSCRGKCAASWKGDGLAAELAALGLRVKEVASDGNCFFLAIADQLEGSSGDHKLIRQRVCQHMLANRANFEPFVEDDEKFDDYMREMATDGSWAGQMELQAASLVFAVNIVVHQAGQPAWSIRNFPKGKTVHLSYHDGEHYNSVRLADDFDPGPAASVPAAAPALATTTARKARSWGGDEELRVSRGTGCHDPGAVQRALHDAAGNVDQAIEILIEWQANEAVGRVVQLSGSLDSAGAAAAPPAGASTGQGPETDQTNSDDALLSEKQPATGDLQRKPSRNKACPCGSGAKYKNCCGAVAAASARWQKAVIEAGHEAGVRVEQMQTLYL